VERSEQEEMELALDRPSLERPDVGRAAEPAAPGRVTDGDLIRRIAARDRDAFDELYARYARPVLGLALRRLRERERAEDAVQETFTAIWRSAASYRPERGAGGPWIYAVARNAIVDRHRGRGEPAAEAPETPDEGRGPDERAVAADLAWRVHRALAELPPNERTVIELAYWSGLSQSEVASYLAIPLGTVKTRTRAALARLASILEGEDLR
jgi:RNA polymerase sigma-70 factor (ECF subfamily)